MYIYDCFRDLSFAARKTTLQKQPNFNLPVLTSMKRSIIVDYY